ncbi:peptidase [Pseudoalteromonas rubra]|uniref:Peptidase n=1 Tax=Pseudoalteromonas rubra TaxID=43658 RepID=A0A5S3WSE3_9GAMM|nr:PepSY-associated TM helix domain-containing protein [Pseudoalteromonas rubra]TMP30166.1 peptidase [Pseudoalteromonas rubra]TMP31966.1 peptidase [Pseudoalteromonas rubra]
MKVRADVLRTYQTLHTWTGITTSLLLFIGFFAGALVMFAPEIDRWATSPEKHMPAIATERYDELLQKVLMEYPKAADSVTLHFDKSLSPVSWYEQGNGRGLALDEVKWHGTLNGDGELVTQLVPVNTLSAMLDMLHRTAGIIGEIDHHQAGVFVLGVAAFAYFIALVSGVIFLLPTLAKRFQALRQDGERKRFWLDGHNLLGIASLPFHIVIAITVTVFAYHDVFYGGLSQLYGDKPMFPAPQQQKIERQLTDLPKVSELVAHVEAHAPGYTVSYIRYANLTKPAASASVGVVNEEQLMRGALNDYVFINPYTFKIASSSAAHPDQNIWAKLVSAFFSLHFGSYGGELGRWAYFLMGLAGAGLFYSGNILWLEKRRRKGTQQQRSYQIMGALTVGVSLGALMGIAAVFASNKWLTLTSVNINHAYLFVYYASFFSVLGAAFVYGPARTAIHGLKLLALLCVIVPATSLLAAVIPATELWTPKSFEALMVEVISLLFGVFFWLLSKHVARRALQNEPGSIWYLKESKATSGISIRHTV